MKFLETAFPCIGVTHPAHLSLTKAILVFFISWVVLFNYQELDCWLGWSPTMCKCSYKHWLGWKVLTAESARNLEICRLGLFGDNESQLPQALFFFLFIYLCLSIYLFFFSQKFRAFSFVRTRAFFRFFWYGCGIICLPAAVAAVDICEI